MRNHLFRSWLPAGRFEVRKPLARVVVTLALVAALIPSVAHAQQKKRVAVLDLELHDTSLEGELQGARDDQGTRTLAASAELRRLLGENAAVEIVDAAPQAAEIDKARPILRCNGCAARIGKALDAELIVIGEVYKVSNLIIDINLYVLDTASGKAVQAASTSIRNNTDESWLRGVKYLATNRLKFQ